MSQQTCAYCGAPLSPGTAFCTSCGTAVSTPDAPSPASPAPSSPLYPTSYATPTPQPVWTPPAPQPAWTPTAQTQSIPQPAWTPSAQPTAPEVVLVEDERILRQVRFTPHLFFPHLKTLVVATNKRIIIRNPHAIFGFIPLGYYMSSTPYSRVASLSSGTRVRTTYAAAGAAAILSGLYSFFTSLGGSSGYGYGSYSYGPNAIGIVMGLVMLVAGGILLAQARVTGLFIHGEGGLVGASARPTELASVESTAHDLVKLMLLPEEERVI